MICFPCCVLGLVLILVVFMPVTVWTNSHYAYIYSCRHYNYYFYFLWKSNVDYPSTSNIRVFKRLWITYFLNMLIKIMNHPPFVKVLIYIFLWPCPFQEKKPFHPWKKFLLPLSICNRKISLFMNPLHNYKDTKHQQHLEAF
jgi:hypothetical protein